MLKRRFAFAPVIAWILKIFAVLMLLLLGYQAITGLMQVLSGFTQFGGLGNPQLVSFLIQSLLILAAAFVAFALLWAIADGLLALREIEFNTRREVVQPVAATSTVIPDAPAPGKPATDEDTPTA